MSILNNAIDSIKMGLEDYKERMGSDLKIELCVMGSNLICRQAERRVR
jgi:hypothetical protein